MVQSGSSKSLNTMIMAKKIGKGIGNTFTKSKITTLLVFSSIG
jgi:hypothetical protein